MNPKASLNVDYTENSFIIIDSNKEIIFFKIDLTPELEMFLPAKPAIGESILESISINYKNDFEQVLNRSTKGDSITLRMEMTHRLTEQPFTLEITCSPIYISGKLTYINCTFGIIRAVTKNLRKFDDYSKFASHELRPPITNILSLSDLKNYPKIKTYDDKHIKILLKDIYQQAEKLDNIILVLNGLINDNEEIQISDNLNNLHQSTSDLINKHIILVDDEPIVNRLHQMLLQKYQKNRIIIDFIDPCLALDYIFKNKPDLIFLDLNMPKINGWEFLKLLEQHKTNVDVIIVSSSIDEHEKVKAKAYPFVKDFLSKPLTSEKINAMFS